MEILINVPYHYVIWHYCNRDYLEVTQAIPSPNCVTIGLKEHKGPLCPGWLSANVIICDNVVASLNKIMLFTRDLGGKSGAGGKQVRGSHLHKILQFVYSRRNSFSG